MPTLEFFVASPPTMAIAPPPSQRVAVEVPATLDPYHQQQLRDALADDLRTGARVLAESLAALAESGALDRCQEEWATGLAELQRTLQQSADRWLTNWQISSSQLEPLPRDASALQLYAESLAQQVTSLAAATNHSPANLDRQLGQLSRAVEAVLDLPAEKGPAQQRRESLIEDLLTTLHSAQKLAEPPRPP